MQIRNSLQGVAIWTVIAFAFLIPQLLGEEATFKVATFNLENYRPTSTDNRPAKPPRSREAVHRTLLSIRPDVVAVQEVGGPDALQSLRQALAHQGLVYSHHELVGAYDTNIQLAVLSRFPFRQRRSHTNDFFVLTGRRYQVARGFAEVTIQPSSRYYFTLLAAHLKSRRPVSYADEAELREAEAQILRKKVEAHLERNEDHNLLVVGDLNDHSRSPALRTVIGRGRGRLIDLQPGERFPGADPVPSSGATPVAWTHFYSAEEAYTRIDYILASRGMASEWRPEETYIPRRPDWSVASDHRPLVATFQARDR